MRSGKLTVRFIWLVALILPFALDNAFSQSGTNASVRVFAVTGVIREVNLNEMTAVVEHSAVSNFMEAMTMPFKARARADLVGLSPGDVVSFELHVAQTNSWIKGITKTGTKNLPAPRPPPEAAASNAILDYRFTNELGQAVALNDFRGQALALTFFYTRCPLPDFCPRLSKNFQEVQDKMAARPGAPTNWHLISVSFDPDFDSPETLKVYGQQYQYDSNDWNFLTGPAEKIAQLARASGVKYESTDGLINHNFRTLIIDASGHLQMIFPTGGDLSDQIVAELLKAAAATNAVR